MLFNSSRILYIILSAALIAVLIFPVILILLPFLLAVFLILQMSSDQESGGYLSEIRTVCKVE